MLTYFLQVNVCWLLFYGAYYALLSRETFFKLNRMWLIASLLAGLALPYIAPMLEVEPTSPRVIHKAVQPVACAFVRHAVGRDLAACHSRCRPKQGDRRQVRDEESASPLPG